MSTTEFMRIAISMHTRTVVGLLNAVERADSPAQRADRLAMIRDATIDFKREMVAILDKAP